MQSYKSISHISYFFQLLCVNMFNAKRGVVANNTVLFNVKLTNKNKHKF